MLELTRHMKHRHRLLATLACGLALGLAWTGGEVDADEGPRPNILWITAEDLSPALGCYGDEYAITPHIDRFAKESVRYVNAFATAPVCSPVRSCLITGCYPTSLGTHQMRSAFPIPKSMQGFPALLRAQGYYTTNNVKTDYNTANEREIIAASWNVSSNTAHWRGRSDVSKPFFAVFNLMTSHQSRSMVWTQDRFRTEVQSKLSQNEIHEPDEAPLPPYYPDTMVTRRTVARFYDCVTAMDKQVGEILEQLEEDGLSESTIVFVYSDHGSGMPRHKRQLHDSGMRVPLLVRFPKRYAHLSPTPAGQVTDRLVSFIDFAPTVLRLTGVKVPREMQGRPFLGDEQEEIEGRRYAFGHRDRVDEAIDLARSVRGKRYLYIRNFMPHLSYNQRTSWPDMGEVRHEFYRVAAGNQVSSAIDAFTADRRPAEELYDCESDPHNLHNLAAAQEHSATLSRMRTVLADHIHETRDLGFIPESLAWPLFRETSGWEFARPHTGEPPVMISDAFRAAGLASGGSEQEILELLASKSATDRYWGAVGLCQLDSISVSARERLRQRLRDGSAAVRIEAANALARNGAIDVALPVLIDAVSDRDLNVVLHATRTVEQLGEEARAAAVAIREVAARSQKLQPATTAATFVLTREQDLAMFCSFSANGFLNRLAEGPWVELFDGDSLAGWTGARPGEARVRNGEIVMTSSQRNVWISTEREFSDFELTAEAAMPRDPDYNAGIGFRCSVDSNGRTQGYQCEIAEELSGALYAIRSGGWVWPKGDEERHEFFQATGPAFRSGKWNHFRVRCEGSRIRIWVNGILATAVEDEKHTTGRVALQHHGKGGAHRYRNIRIRELGSADRIN